MAEAMRGNVAQLLRGIDRYNPENLQTLERYVEMQAKENVYDLEANLAVLKLYQFNPNHFQTTVVANILLKALTNLPHTDFVLCKCLIDYTRFESEDVLYKIAELANTLEMCDFKSCWSLITSYPELVSGISGIEDSIRKYVCHVVSITYQTIERPVLHELLGSIDDGQVTTWINKYGWKDLGGDQILITNQDEVIKTKNIKEKITFESVAGIMASHPPIGGMR